MPVAVRRAFVSFNPVGSSISGYDIPPGVAASNRNPTCSKPHADATSTSCGGESSSAVSAAREKDGIQISYLPMLSSSEMRITS